VDELGPTPVAEVTSAVADFDGYSSQAAQPTPQHESSASPVEQPSVDALEQMARPDSAAESQQEAEKAAARRRSTVREKVSFLANAHAEAEAPGQSQPQPTPARDAESSQQPASETTDNQPRRAGWWSRRFGGGE
jgi:ribonuclease E